MSARIAILGTGKMGAAIAARLAETGFELTLWNRTAARAQALGLGTVAKTAAAAVRDADIVISSLTGPEAISATYLGAEGALDGGRGKLFIEMSTAGPDVVEALARDVVASGNRLIDAPILGGPPLVRRGAATVITSGAARDVEQAAPLAGLGLVRYVGPLGSASRLKLVANSMLAIVSLAAAELQTAGEHAGLDPEDVFWVLARLVPALEQRRRGYLDDEHAPPIFALRDLAKDLDLALALFRGLTGDTPLTALTDDLVTRAAATTGTLDISSLIRAYRTAEATLESAHTG